MAQAEIQQRVFPDAEIVVLPASGHWPFADDPGAVETAASAFWGQTITRTTSAPRTAEP